MPLAYGSCCCPLQLLPQVCAHAFMHAVTSRHSFFLTGPCVSTDTACSSSLVATHLAHTGLLNQETVAAVAAGTNVMLSPMTTVAICQLQVRLQGAAQPMNCYAAIWPAAVCARPAVPSHAV